MTQTFTEYLLVVTWKDGVTRHMIYLREKERNRIINLLQEASDPPVHIVAYNRDFVLDPRLEAANHYAKGRTL